VKEAFVLFSRGHFISCAAPIMLKKKEIIMKQDDDQFSLQDIDQWIEQLAQYETHETGENNQDVQLVKLLRYHYSKERQQKKLQHVWEAISQQYDAAIGATETDANRNTLQKKPEKNPRHHQVHQTSKRRNFSLWETWLSVAVLIVVIGSFAVIISHATQIKSTPESGGHHPIMCTSTSTNAPTPPTAVPTAAPTSAYCIKVTSTSRAVPTSKQTQAVGK
jgi:sulfur relay (sulfurtransferase) DsrC/TusE family protein